MRQVRLFRWCFQGDGLLDGDLVHDLHDAGACGGGSRNSYGATCLIHMFDLFCLARLVVEENRAGAVIEIERRL